MSQADHYSTKQAAEITGASRQIIRTYTERYQRHFSTEGAPEQPGQPRRFTADDLKLIRYIYSNTAEQKLTHDQVLAALAAGALAQFDWQPPLPSERPEPAESAAPGSSTALVPVERLQAAQALLADAQRREAEAAQREQTLQERLAQLERELGRAQGELAGYKAAQRRPPAGWVTLFGGSRE